MTTSACKFLLKKNKNKKQNRKLYEQKKTQKQRILLSHDDIEKHPLGDK